MTWSIIARDPATGQFATPAELFAREVATPPSREYASPDGSLVLPAFRVFHQGPPDYRGWRFSHSLDTYGFSIARPGARIYVSAAAEGRTYAATVGANGALKDLEVFVERGGESVATDASGRVFEIVSEKKIQVRDDYCIENYVNDPRTTPEEQLVTEILIPTV